MDFSSFPPSSLLSCSAAHSSVLNSSAALNSGLHVLCATGFSSLLDIFFPSPMCMVETQQRSHPDKVALLLCPCGFSIVCHARVLLRCGQATGKIIVFNYAPHCIAVLLSAGVALWSRECAANQDNVHLYHVVLGKPPLVFLDRNTGVIIPLARLL